jgi:DNA polymerase III delta prime subunit
MPHLSRSLKISLQIGLSAVGVGIIINLITDIIKEPLIRYLGENYETTVAGLLLLIVFALIWLEMSSKAEGEDVKTNVRDEFLGALKQRYEARYLSKMNGELLFDIDLDLYYTKEGTDLTYIDEYYIDDYEESSAGDFNRLFEKFNDELKRLLIIGEPGSGKTVLMLKFAAELLKKAETDPHCSIPIMLDLATWNDSSQSFEHWLGENFLYIAREIGYSKSPAKEILKNNNYILLLDGLDEVEEKYRVVLLESLTSYLTGSRKKKRTKDPDVILCCRRVDYGQINANAPVRSTIVIKPLSGEILLKSLREITAISGKGPANKLIKVIEEEVNVPAILTSAFNVQITLSLMTDLQIDPRRFKSQKDLVMCYLEKQIQSTSNHHNVTDSRRWLQFLAMKIEQSDKKSNFELTDIKLEWTSYTLILRLVHGVIISAALNLFSTAIGFSLGHYVIYVSIIFFLLGATTLPDSIDTENRFSLNFEKFSFKLFIKSALEVGAPFLLFVIIGVANLKTLQVFIFPWLLITFLLTLHTQSRKGRVGKPYQKLLDIYLSDIMNFLSIGVVIIIGRLTLQNNNPSELINLAIKLIIAFFFLASVVSLILRHLLFRFDLFLSKKLPLRLVTFLNLHSSTSGLLERIGGTWRFRHQLIQECLNDLNEAE